MVEIPTAEIKLESKVVWYRQLHQPFPLVVQEIRFVQFLLSDQAAQCRQTSPVALENQVHQEGLDRPEIQVIFWPVAHLMTHTCMICARRLLNSPLALEAQSVQEDLPVRHPSLPATHSLRSLHGSGEVSEKQMKQHATKAHLISLWPWGSLCPLHGKHTYKYINRIKINSLFTHCF